MTDIRNRKLALIDGDELVYKSGFASQHVHYEVYEDEDAIDWVARFPYKNKAVEWINGQEGMVIKKTLEVLDVDDAYMALRSAFNTIMRDTGAYRYKIFLTGENNFRFNLATIRPYKDRPEENKPVHYMALKAILVEDYNAEVIDNMEADDALSINQYNAFNETKNWKAVNTVICTQDKDLNMVPGPRYSPRTRKNSFITPEEARHFFYCQLLAGDETDSIPGIYRMGMQTADKLYKGKRVRCEKDYYQVAVHEYARALKDPKCREKLPTDLSAEEVVNEIGNLLWMKRSIEDRWEPDIKFI